MYGTTDRQSTSVASFIYVICMYVFALPSATCPEVMSDQTLLPNSAIDVSPATLDIPADLLGPTGKGLTISQADTPTTITLRLVGQDSKEPVQLVSIRVLGDGIDVEAEVQKTQNGAFELFENGQRFPVEDGPVTFADDDEIFKVFSVKVTLYPRSDATLPMTAKLQVYACITGTICLAKFLKWQNLYECFLFQNGSSN